MGILRDRLERLERWARGSRRLGPLQPIGEPDPTEEEMDAICRAVYGDSVPQGEITDEEIVALLAAEYQVRTGKEPPDLPGKPVLPYSVRPFEGSKLAED